MLRLNRFGVYLKSLEPRTDEQIKREQYRRRYFRNRYIKKHGDPDLKGDSDIERAWMDGFENGWIQFQFRKYNDEELTINELEELLYGK
jgi:hypothetical protein